MSILQVFIACLGVITDVVVDGSKHFLDSMRMWLASSSSVLALSPTASRMAFWIGSFLLSSILFLAASSQVTKIRRAPHFFGFLRSNNNSKTEGGETFKLSTTASMNSYEDTGFGIMQDLMNTSALLSITLPAASTKALILFAHLFLT